MRVMVIVKASPESEAGALPDQEMLARMGAYNEALADAGVMMSGEGLHPSARGVRVRFDRDDRSVVDGPFPETRELVAGFWLWKVDSMDEAISWIRRAPFSEGEVELRPVYEDDDFGDDFTPELREQEARIREQTSALRPS